MLSGAGARVGGRFWALAGAEEEDADGDDEDPDAAPPTPTPSDLFCEFFHAGYDEDEVASTVDRVLPVEDTARVGLHAGERKEMVRRVVHRRTAATAVRPWKGPLPKVSLPNLTLFDLIHPDSWIQVKRKKRPIRSGGVPAAAMARSPARRPISISQQRAMRLNALLGCALEGRPDGPALSEPGLVLGGPEVTGYEAPVNLDFSHGQIATPPCTIDRTSAVSRSRRSRVILPRLRSFADRGAGRARRVPPLLCMAGGNPPPAKASAQAGVPSSVRRGGLPPPAGGGRGGDAATLAAGRGRSGLPLGAGRAAASPTPNQVALGANGARQALPGGLPRPGGVGRGTLPAGRPPPPVADRGGLRPPAPLPAATAGRGTPSLRPLAPALAGQPRPTAMQTGARPPHFVARQSPNPSAPVLEQAQLQMAPVRGGDSSVPRGQWGDDGLNAYGDGQHRGSSSTGGGRGYAWQSDGSTERPFLGPTGGFVEGASGPANRNRGGFRGNRGGRGGRGGRYRPRQQHVVVDQMPVGADTDETALTCQAMEVVTALAEAVPTNNGEVEVMSVEGSEKAELDRAAKYARKKERMLCYRCGNKGHFIAECVAPLCDTCGKPDHESGACPVLREQLPNLMMYGVFCSELTFFESPVEKEVSDEVRSMTSGIVKVTKGEVSEVQIVQRLRERAPGDFLWELVSLEPNSFRVEFPSVEDLQRLLSFGMCKVPGTNGILEFHEWKLSEPQGKPLTQAWLRFSGAPHRPLQDARVVASMAVLVGKPERVDMAFTRAQGVARILVSILDIEYVPDVVKWAYRGQVYNLQIEFEDDSLFADTPATVDVDMHEGDDDRGSKEPPVDDSGREAERPGSGDKTTGGVTAPPSMQVMTTSLEGGRRQETSVPHPSMALIRATEREESSSGGRLAPASSVGRVGVCLGQVAPATPAALALAGSEGGCMGQEAPYPSPSASTEVVSTEVASTALIGGGPGKATPGHPSS
ncbi:hypothetical protein ACQJBY_028582 [Aegilops geniculata]